MIRLSLHVCSKLKIQETRFVNFYLGLKCGAKRPHNTKGVTLLHMDLFGLTQYTSIGGKKYGFVIVDDYTRYIWVFFLVDKNDVFATFKSFVKGIHNEFETTIKRVRSDNGSEFKNTRIDELYKQDQDWHHFVNTSHLCHPWNQRR